MFLLYTYTTATPSLKPHKTLTPTSHLYYPFPHSTPLHLHPHHKTPQHPNPHFTPHSTHIPTLYLHLHSKPLGFHTFTLCHSTNTLRIHPTPLTLTLYPKTPTSLRSRQQEHHHSTSHNTHIPNVHPPRHQHFQYTPHDMPLREPHKGARSTKV